MAEDTFVSTRGGKFRTNRFPGFFGGSTDEATGNLVPGRRVSNPNPLAGDEAAALLGDGSPEEAPGAGGGLGGITSVRPIPGTEGDGGGPEGQDQSVNPPSGGGDGDFSFGKDVIDFGTAGDTALSLAGTFGGPFGIATNLGAKFGRNVNNLAYAADQRTKRFGAPNIGFWERLASITGVDRIDALGLPQYSTGSLYGGESTTEGVDPEGAAAAKRQFRTKVTREPLGPVSGASAGQEDGGGDGLTDAARSGGARGGRGEKFDRTTNPYAVPNYAAGDITRETLAPIADGGAGASGLGSITRAPESVGGPGSYDARPESTVGDAAGGGRGGESRVICTELRRRALIDRETYAADIEHARTRISETTIRGYHLWAIPLVRLMRRGGVWGRVAIRLFRALATWRAEELAHVMGRRSRGNLKGKIVRLAIEPICFVIGTCVPAQNYRVLYQGDEHATSA